MPAHKLNNRSENASCKVAHYFDNPMFAVIADKCPVLVSDAIAWRSIDGGRALATLHREVSAASWEILLRA